VSPPSFFDPALALSDFKKELRSCDRPCYPECSWSVALAKAEALDDLRRRDAAQLAIDATEYYAAHGTYLERLYGSTIARMNGQTLHLTASEPEFAHTLPAKTALKH
jgi:hypothetical protein